jgi:peptidyl-prolyl cis-trans isomerase D
MLDTLRANSRSVLTYVLFGIIIVVFVVSFGPGSRGCTSGGRSDAWAAKVNGEAITPTDFDQQYGQLARLYQQQLGGDPSGALQLRLRQMAMDQVVQRELIEQEGRKKGIAVTDDEVSAAIKAIPGFQTNGVFDLDLYKRAVANAYGSPGKFEERMRRDLAYQKMATLLRSTVKVTDDEVKDAWMAENDRADLEVARFPLAAARAAIVPTDAQVKDYLAKEGARIDQFYKDNPARFDRKKRVHARHILVRADEKAPQAQQDEAKKKVEGFADRIKKGEDFAKLAGQVSEDPGSKGQGGDLGFFGQGVMAKEFEGAAFALKPGQVSDPVKTSFGWHLIKVEEVQEPEQISLEKARPEIARDLAADDLAKKLATEKAAEALKKLQVGRSFAEVFPDEAKGKATPVKLGTFAVKPETTGSFTASSAPNIPRVGPAPDLFADSMKANAGQVLAKVYETSYGPVIARVKERQRPDAAKFAERKSEVEVRLRLRREADVERTWVEDLKKRSKVETNQAFVLGTARAPNVELD